MPSVLIPDVGVVQFDDSLTGDVLTAEVAKAAKVGLAQKKTQLQGERTSTLGQLPGALLDTSDEAQALTEAVQANAQRLKGMTPEQIGAENIARFRAQGGGSIPLSSEIQQQNDIAQGITPVVVDAPPNLPKLTSGEAQTLVTNPRLANVVKAAQNTASGVADSLVGTGVGTGAFGAAEGAFAKAFIPQMLTSGTKAALDSVDAYKAGDLETGDAKAVEALTTGLMLGAPHAVDTILRRQLPEAKLARLIDQAKAKLPSVEEAAQAGGTPISPEPTREIANPVSEAIPGATAPILSPSPTPQVQQAAVSEVKSPVDQAPEPTSFNTIEDLLAFREKRLSEERELYKKAIGLDDAQSSKLQRIIASPNGDVDRFASKLPNDQQEKLTALFDGPLNQTSNPNAFKFWDTDTRLNPEEIANDTDPELLSAALVSAVVRDVKPEATSDKFISAVIASRRLKEIGATRSDVARYLDRYTTRESSNMADKKEFFDSLGGKVMQFLQSQGIDLPEGNLGRLKLKDKALSGAGSTPSESPLTPKTVTASQAEPVEVTASAGPSASGETSQKPNISLVGEQPMPAGTDNGPSKGIAASVRNKWTNATDPAFGSEAGFFSLAPLHSMLSKLSPALKKTADEILAVGKETLKAGKVNDYRRSVLNWSGKLQKSFGEASEAKREINAVVPDKVRQEGITNWIQANGDPSVLRARAAASNAKNRPGYEAALTLTPKELAIANDVKAAFNTLHARGSFYDVVNSFVDNYVPQIWNLKKGPTYGGARNLRDQFRHNRARAFDTFFDGEQAGYVPKTKAIGDLLPMYLHEMNSVIANRQMVEQLSKGQASDGRPLVVPRGSGSQVTNPAGKSATLVIPKAITTDTADYKTIPNQPALHDWKWASTDSAGNPVLLKADLALHPEAYNHLKNVLGKSALREWYSIRTSAVAQIPKLLVHGIDAANSGTKRTMLGMFATFHQVQEGMHALGHRVNPFFSIPKIDLVGDPGQFNAAKHGLMLLPDRVSANQFMEGFKTSGLISRIPAIGPLADHYSEYLFHQYIPGLKYKTYQSILDRNTKLYAKELASGEYTSGDIATLSAEQTNAAFGHLNYADLGRSPTVQHFLQLGLLAPDFLEARTRFALQSLKGASGSKVGREQLIALGVLAVTQAALAYTGAKLTDGDWDWKRPFEFRKGNRTYTMRSVPEDLQRLVTDTRSFIHSRLSPITGKAAYQLATGTDWRGQKVTATQTAKELALQPVPISLRGLLGVGNSPLSGWEQLAGSVGVKISRYSPTAEVMQLASDYKKKSADPKVAAQYEQDQKTVHPSSQLKPLRDAIQKASQHEFNSAYDKLIADGKTKASISEAMRQTKPYTGSYKLESKFKASLSPDQRKIYDEALKEHAMLYDKFNAMLKAKK
jgi:hypothetical protein